MATPEAPTWWADVQQDREQIGERAVDSWIDEEIIDFTPRRRFVHAESTPVAKPPLSPPPVAGRRTVTITGQPQPLVPQRRELRPVSHRLHHARPDRIALWAAILGFFLILVAATSSSDASAATGALAGI